jgi:hypothetical protein
MKIVQRGETRFDFVSGSGDSIGADSIGVLRINGDRPIWWIVSDKYSETWTPEGGEELFAMAADQGREIIQAFRAVSSGPVLSQITYGKVPTGFRQMIPERGTAPSLERGARYVLHFLGSDVAAFEFDF